MHPRDPLTLGPIKTQVLPRRILGFYQLFFFPPAPTFYLFFPGDCRFYVIPADGITDPLAPVFACYTLNRSFPTTVAEKMTLETFVREVGREWYNLAIVQGVVEEDEDDEDEE